MITLDNSAIIGLTGNKAVTDLIPFIKQAIQATSSCCGKANSASPNMNHIKMQIAHLPPSSQARLKELTGWDKVRVVYESGKGTQTVIF